MTVLLAFLLGLVLGILLAAGAWFWFMRRKMRTMFGDMFPGVDAPMSFLDAHPCSARCVRGDVPGLTGDWQDFMAVAKGARIAFHTVDEEDHDVNIDVDVVAPVSVRPEEGARRGRFGSDSIMTVNTATGAAVELRLHALVVGIFTTELKSAPPFIES